eukprot:sb/3472247/
MFAMLITILSCYSGLLVVSWKALRILEKQVSLSTEVNLGVKKRALETLSILVVVQILAYVYQLCAEGYILVLLEKIIDRYEAEDDRCVGLEENFYTAWAWILTFYFQSTVSSIANPIIHITRNRNLNTWNTETVHLACPGVCAHTEIIQRKVHYCAPLSVRVLLLTESH